MCGYNENSAALSREGLYFVFNILFDTFFEGVAFNREKAASTMTQYIEGGSMVSSRDKRDYRDVSP